MKNTLLAQQITKIQETIETELQGLAHGVSPKHATIHVPMNGKKPYVLVTFNPYFIPVSEE
jgi:hypothetical protein